MSSRYHVYPEHETHLMIGTQCECKPQLVWREDLEDHLIVHQSWLDVEIIVATD